MSVDADAATLFSLEATVRAMLAVEGALARVEARLGLIPLQAATDIASAAGDTDAFDLNKLAHEASEAGNLAIPLLRALTDLIKSRNPESAGFVHWGATSQDIIDTALALQMRAALERIGQRLRMIRSYLRDLATRHSGTLMVARTLLQPALPTTFGLKAAYWLAPLTRAQHRLNACAAGLPVQLGGAAGTLAAFGSRGTAVAEGLAGELGLRMSEPWHTDRTIMAEATALLGILGGSLGKIAGDMLLMSQSEIGELSERGPGGGSSTLPHKRNPVALVGVAAAARRLPGLVATVLACQLQEHERAAGAWHAERSAIPEVFTLVGAACAHMEKALSRLAVDASRMRSNLDSTRGLAMAEAVAMALSRHVGREQAQALVREAADLAVENASHLSDALARNGRIRAFLDTAEIRALTEPGSYLGEAETILERILQADRECEEVLGSVGAQPS